MRGVYWHFGDYYSDTQGLSWLEDWVYRKLLEWAYMHEQPLSSNLEEIHGACFGLSISPKKCRTATEKILEKFWHLEPDGWHHNRVDKELGRYHEKAPGREQRKASNRLRQQRFALIRKIYVHHLRLAGMQVSGKSPIKELQQIAGRLGLANAVSLEVNNAVSQLENQANANGVITPLSTPIEGLTPNNVPGTLNPISNVLEHVRTPLAPLAPNGAADVRASVENETAASVAASARVAGLGYANPRDALLLALIAAGATLPDFLMAVEQAKAGGKGWAYMLGIVKGRQSDAAKAAGMVQEGPKSGPQRPIADWLRDVAAAGREIESSRIGKVEQK